MSERGDETGARAVSNALSGPIEALLLMSEEPVSAATLADAVGASTETVTETLGEIARFYDETGRGFELRHVAEGWRLYTRTEHAELISSWLLEDRRSTLSQAALETLSVIAYLQPISRGRVSAVRGVSVDGVIKTLLARGLIAEAGTDGGSGATLFVTTGLFLEKLGLASLSELPALAPHLPEAQALEAELADLAAEREARAAAAEASEGHGGDEPTSDVAPTSDEPGEPASTGPEGI